MSVATASPMSTGVNIAVASLVMSSGTSRSGHVLSVMVIFCVLVIAFPFASVAVHVTTVVPRG